MSAVDTETIAVRVAACPGVVELSGGATGTIATYLPGRRVVGVRVEGPTVEVHVVAGWDIPIPELAGEIRTAVAGYTDGHDLDIVVEDLGDRAVDPSRPVSTP